MINYSRKRAIERGWKCNSCGSQDLREKLKHYLVCKDCNFTNSKNAMSYIKNKRHTYYEGNA